MSSRRWSPSGSLHPPCEIFVTIREASMMRVWFSSVTSGSRRPSHQATPLRLNCPHAPLPDHYEGARHVQDVPANIGASFRCYPNRVHRLVDRRQLAFLVLMPRKVTEG